MNWINIVVSSRKPAPAFFSYTLRTLKHQDSLVIAAVPSKTVCVHSSLALMKPTTTLSLRKSCSAHVSIGSEVDRGYPRYTINKTLLRSVPMNPAGTRGRTTSTNNTVDVDLRVTDGSAGRSQVI
jgi:hypothetical protein